MKEMRTIFEIAEHLGLDVQQFRELVDQGRLDGMQLDRDCVERVRQMFLVEARAAPSATKH
jgi:hypothetical protein